MAVADTAKLVVDLSLTGNYQAGLSKAQRGFSNLGKSITDTQGRAYKAGQQIGTGIKRGALLAVSGITALIGVLALSVKEGQDAQKVQQIYAKAIENSGKVSADYVKALNAQQKALENLAGVDDELIKTEQTRLIQMGLTGKQVLAITPAILDFSKATGIDLLTATKLAGKAAQGNTGALKRYGVEIDKAKAKTDPFGATLDALTKKFGGTTKALSGDLSTRLAAFHEALSDIREEAGIKLLPALTRIVDVAGKELVPAFGKFIDRVMPAVLDGLNQFADLLEHGGAEKGINAITDALVPLVKLVQVAAAPVKAIVGAFLSLPKEVQTVLVGAFAVNKLTGGLVTNVAGGLVGAVVKGLGSIIGKNVVQPVFVTNQIPGIPGGGGLPGGVPGAAVGTAISGLTAGLLVSIPIAIGAALGEASRQAFSGMASHQAQLNLRQEAAARGARQGFGMGAFNRNVLAKPDIDLSEKSIQALRAGFAQALHPNDRDTGEGRRGKIGDALAKAEQKNPKPVQTPDIEGLRTRLAAGLRDTQADVEKVRGQIAAGLQPKVSEVGADALRAGAVVASAIGGIQAPITNVNVDVNVTAGGIHKTVTINNRYGPATGSAQSDLNAGTSGHLGR